MKKLFLVGLLTILSINAIAQQKIYSNFQVVKNINGVKSNHYNVNISIKEPKKIGGDIGFVTVNLIDVGSSLEYLIKYVKETKDVDGNIYWYYIVNSERGEVFNILKLQKFKKLTQGYKYCLMLSKYDSNASLLYEHYYFSN